MEEILQRKWWGWADVFLSGFCGFSGSQNPDNPLNSDIPQDPENPETPENPGTPENSDTGNEPNVDLPDDNPLLTGDLTTDPTGGTSSDPTVDIQDENVPMVGGIGATGSEQVPQTGDTVAVIIWACLFVTSLLSMAVLFVQGKKKSA